MGVIEYKTELPRIIAGLMATIERLRSDLRDACLSTQTAELRIFTATCLEHAGDLSGWDYCPKCGKALVRAVPPEKGDGG